MLAELRRRKVFRVATAYAVAAWGVAQIGDLVLANTSAPPWVMQVILLLLALGFPIALVLAWAFERDGSLARYTGVYKSIWGQSVFVPWDDGLPMLYLGSSSPTEGMVRLQHVEDHTFRRVRDDDSLGETVRFEMGEDGQSERVWRHSGWAQRLKD